MSAPKSHTGSPAYQLFMLALCVYALATLVVHVAVPLTSGTEDILDYADYCVCALFFVDFVISMIRASNRRRYFFTWGWIDLLSSIPMVNAARWGRLARVVRILRILRGLRATRILVLLVVRRRAESAFLAAALVALLLVIFCSIAILNVETLTDSNIKTAEDAIWWAFATITTVGYGDRYPVTSEGRFVAAVLMCGGVGLFGTFSGFLASWFVGAQGQADGDSHEVLSEIRALREEVARLRASGRDPGERGGA